MKILHPDNQCFLYDDADKQSILRYALLLQGRTLGEMACLTGNNDLQSGNKGKFGQILEKYYFFKKLNSDSRPDFYEAGIELKSSPLKKFSKKSIIRAKE
ncbi:DNA mismatch repair protein [Neisseria animalis]|nr:DNA mismatch repair protein [Neisseria animalis]